MHRVTVRLDWIGLIMFGNRGYYLKCKVCGELNGGDLIPNKKNAKVRAREHERYGPV